MKVLITPEHVNDALRHARSVYLEDLIAELRPWLEQELTVLMLAIDETARRAGTRDGEKGAQAVLCGAYVGSSILKRLADEGAIDPGQCRPLMGQNHIDRRGFDYKDADGGDEWLAMFGEPTCAAFNEIGDPYARSVCQFVAGHAILGVPAELLLPERTDDPINTKLT